MNEYVVFTYRSDGCAHVVMRTYNYEQAHKRAKLCGGSVMFSDDFARAYKVASK